ncbi:hypothetical protein C8F01DRAFT_621766 [Mycena amicta]|nr:hypothetical protein C8F01DRAFT_621766 [Mycena amicta]
MHPSYSLVSLMVYFALLLLCCADLLLEDQSHSLVIMTTPIIRCMILFIHALLGRPLAYCHSLDALANFLARSDSRIECHLALLLSCWSQRTQSTSHCAFVSLRIGNSIVLSLSSASFQCVSSLRL